MAAPTKKYGLITLPKKNKDAKPAIKKASIFDSDSDEDGMTAVNKEINLTSKKNNTKRQTQLEIDKALADDPTVYSYDEVYDDMKNKEKEQYEEKLNISKTTVEKKSRYISGLLKAAEKRKTENERRLEKKVQKEREAEGDEFADKEKFVTSAYKKKMAEMEANEAEEKRKEALEAAMDVTKQSDMSGFYRNLYKQTVGTGPDVQATTEKTKEEEVKQEGEEPEVKQEVEDRLDVTQEKEETNSSNTKKDNKRQYRRRSSSEESPSPERKQKSRPRSRSHSPNKERSKRHSSRSRSPHKDRSRRRSSRSRSKSRDRRRDRDKDKNKRHMSRSRERDRSRDGKGKERDSSRHREKDNKKSKRSPTDHEKTTDKAENITTENKSETEKKDRFGKRNDGEAVMSARERYLARKAAKQ